MIPATVISLVNNREVLMLQHIRYGRPLRTERLPDYDWQIVADLWKEGRDTLQIACLLNATEPLIYNGLSRMRK